MLSKKQLILKTLREAGAEVYRKIPTINSGGCCVYAAHVARHLEMVEGVTSEVVVGGDADLSRMRDIYGTLKISMTEFYRHNVSFWHVGVRFWYRAEVFTHDTDATQAGGHVVGNDLMFRPSLGGMTVEEALYVYEHGEWNSTFDPMLVPKMVGIIKKHFKQLCPVV